MSDTTCPTCGSGERSKMYGPLRSAAHFVSNCPDAWHDERPTTPEDVEAACVESESWRKCLSDDLHHDVAGNHIPCPWCSAEHGHTSTCLASRVITSGRNTEATLRARIEALTAERDEAVRNEGLGRCPACGEELMYIRTAMAINDAIKEQYQRAEAAEQRVAVLEAAVDWLAVNAALLTNGVYTGEHWRSQKLWRDAALAAAEES